MGRFGVIGKLEVVVELVELVLHRYLSSLMVILTVVGHLTRMLVMVDRARPVILLVQRNTSAQVVQVVKMVVRMEITLGQLLHSVALVVEVTVLITTAMVPGFSQLQD